MMLGRTFAASILVYSVMWINVSLAITYYYWKCQLGTQVWTCSSGKNCGNTYATCIDAPSQPLSSSTIIILVVVGVLTAAIVIVGIVFFCYFRRRQQRRRRLLLLQFSTSFQPMQTLDCRAFGSTNPPPTHPQVTENNQHNEPA